MAYRTFAIACFLLLVLFIAPATGAVGERTAQRAIDPAELSERLVERARSYLPPRRSIYLDDSYSHADVALRAFERSSIFYADCSGFVYQVFKDEGVADLLGVRLDASGLPIGATVVAYREWFKHHNLIRDPSKEGAPKRGDLVLYQDKETAHRRHIGIFDGKQLIHSGTYGDGGIQEAAYDTAGYDRDEITAYVSIEAIAKLSPVGSGGSAGGGGSPRRGKIDLGWVPWRWSLTLDRNYAKRATLSRDGKVAFTLAPGTSVDTGWWTWGTYDLEVDLTVRFDGEPAGLVHRQAWKPDIKISWGPSPIRAKASGAGEEWDIGGGGPRANEPVEKTAPSLHKLEIGSWARVTGTGACLNFRAAPTATAPLATIRSGSEEQRVCRQDGYVAFIHDGPRDADGHTWWHLGTSTTPVGWATDAFLEPAEAPTVRGDDVAYIGSDGNLWLLSLATREHRRLTTVGSLLNPTWSPDGTRLAATSWPSASQPTVVVVDPATGQVSTLSHGVAPRWSPDGKTIAFVELANAILGSYIGKPAVMSASGTGRLTPDSRPDRSIVAPTWSPDSRRIAYVAGQSGTSPFTAVYIADASVGNATPPAVFTSPVNSGTIINAAWSPDGRSMAIRRVVFGSSTVGDLIFDVSSRTTRTIRAPDLPAIAGSCEVSADDFPITWLGGSETLILGTGCNGAVDYWSVNTSDLSTSRLNLRASGVTFSPSGEQVVYSERDCAAGPMRCIDRLIFRTLAVGANEPVGNGRSPQWRPGN